MILTESRPRGFVDVKRCALTRQIPITVHLELTYDCDCACVFCYNPKARAAPLLSVGEWNAVLADLRELGAITVTLTGGDPLAHAGFFDVAEAVRARAFALRVFTNGLRVSEEAAGRLADLRPLSVEISLQGATAETHDRVTRRPGSFAAVWRAVERLRARGAPVLLKTVLASLNEGELDAIIALSKDLPLRIDATIAPCDDGDLSPLRFRASREAIETLMTRLRAAGQIPTTRHEPGGVNCGLGRITLTVDPFGSVYPCMQWRASSLGNVRERSLVDLWRQSPARDDVARIAGAANDRLMAVGGAASRFPFCPALAAQRAGDPLSLDGEFLMYAEAAEKARSQE